MTEPSPPPDPRPPPDDAAPTPAESGMPPWSDTQASGDSAPAGPRTERPAGRAEDMATIGRIGRYALKYPIGEGGLGAVYAAYDPLLSRVIAIKTLHLQAPLEQRDELNALFLNEARAAAGLSHPHIVTVFDAGLSEQGDAWIAMELLKGRDLRALRREGWQPSAAQSALIVRRVADALAYAHSKGVIHRDIKPANIFMVGRTQPRVLDFGIARVTHRPDAPGDELAAGSPYYMAPEQLQHQTVDARADVFSLGVVLYELLAGQKPFQGDTLEDIQRAVSQHEPPLAHEVRADVPAALSAIAARALRKDPQQRHPSARALSRDLRHWLAAHERSATGAGELASALRSPTVWGGALAALALLGAVGWWGLDVPRRLSASVLASAASAGAAADADKADERASAALATAQAALAQSASTSAAMTPSTRTATMSPSEGGAGMLVTPPAQTDAAAPAPPPAAIAAHPAATPSPAASALAAGADAAEARSTSRSDAPSRSAKVRPAPSRQNTSSRRPPPSKQRIAPASQQQSTTPVVAAPPASGVLRIAISPWGSIDVNGANMGTAPPLNQLTLPAGRHRITVRNADFPPYSATIEVTPDHPVTLKHRFGT